MARPDRREEPKSRTWRGRRGAARALRVALLALPIATSVVLVVLVSRVVERPADLAGTIAWYVAISALATVAMMIADRALRRLLPLAALLELSLVFPDSAPSRFKLALRTGTVKQFRRQLEAGETPTTQESAETLLALVARLGDHDRLTRGHSERVRAYANLIAEELEIDDVDRQKLHWSALLHDIGKLSVPGHILNKPGRPDEEEWAILQRHPAEAEALVEPLSEWLGEWRLAASEHHERWDGAGYPNGLEGSGISLAGRIVGVADAYDTMTSVRSYKKAMSAEEARAELTRCAGSQFDPAVVRAFLRVSLGRLRLIMGPFSWLAHSPILATAPVASSAAASTAAATAVTATMLAAGFVPVEIPPPTEIVAPAEEAPADLAFLNPAPEPTRVEAPSRTAEPSRTSAPPTPSPGPTSTPTLPRDDDPTTEPTSAPTPTTGLTLPSTLAPTAPPPTPTPADTSRAPTATDSTPTPASEPTVQPTSDVLPTPTPATEPTSDAAPITTPPAEPTSDPAPTSTTTKPTPEAVQAQDLLLYLTNPGSGDTRSSAVLDLSENAPTVAGLPNYDTDRDSAPGLSLQRGAGTSELNNEKLQLWAMKTGAADAPGTVKLVIHAAARRFDPGRRVVIQFELRRCDVLLVDCDSLTRASGGFTQPSSAVFTPLVLGASFSEGPTDLKPVLALIVAPTEASEDDVWIAYDTTTHTSALHMGFG